MMENKGLISAEEWREFCAGTVVLGEFASFTGMMGEDIRFDVQISECDPEKRIPASTVPLWTVSANCTLAT